MKELQIYIRVKSKEDEARLDLDWNELRGLAKTVSQRIALSVVFRLIVRVFLAGIISTRSEENKGS